LVGCRASVADRIMVSEDVHILIPGTYDELTLSPCQRDFTDGIKV
jgi:hypothetical protein